ncbi:MAG: chorismate synthase [Phycisphaerae bacterium]|nr:chorismate synthase [Phycisphaerae bacterium]
MAELNYRTAGESHGRALTVLIEGLPAGLAVDLPLINGELRRRQGGYGRGARMKIERDEVLILSGVRAGQTMGSPLVLQIANRDFRIDDAPVVQRPRPGHADFAGAMKWLTTDCRETLERASARETAARVAAGALAKCLLSAFGVQCVGFVAEIGTVRADAPADVAPEALVAARDGNDVYTPDESAVAPMRAAIRQAKKDRDTVGGVVEVRVYGVPPGLGTCAAWQEKLDGRLMQAVGSIQAMKGVEIGLGFEAARRPGSAVHDALYYDAAQRDTANFGFVRRSNRAGGLEGGMTNGMPLVVRAAMKPIATLLQGLDSVNLETRQPERSAYERSDVCAVPAASVVAENVVAFEVARAWLQKFGGDTLREVRAAYEFYAAAVRGLGAAPEVTAGRGGSSRSAARTRSRRR